MVRHSLVYRARCLAIIVGALAIVALCVIAAACVSGCSAIRGACASALPTITASQSYSSDASGVLQQIRTLPADAALTAAIEDCEEELQAIDKALVAASSACSATDALTTFSSFLAAWNALEPLASSALSGLRTASMTRRQVPIPLIVLKARGKL